MNGRVCGKTATPFFGARLHEEDHDVLGGPIPQIQHKTQANKKVNTNGTSKTQICKATVYTADTITIITLHACTGSNIFGRCYYRALLFERGDGRIRHLLICAHVVQAPVGKHGVVTTSLRKLIFKPQEIIVDGAAQVLRIAECEGIKPCTNRGRERATTGSRQRCRDNMVELLRGANEGIRSVSIKRGGWCTKFL